MNPALLPWQIQGQDWRRGGVKYEYEWLSSCWTWGAAPYAPLYRFDGQRWHAYRTELRMARPCVASDGSIVIVTEQGRIDPVSCEPLLECAERQLVSQGLAEDPLAVYPGRHGRRWCVANGALFRIRGPEAEPIRLDGPDDLRLSSLLADGITALVEDRDGSVWIGLPGRGLLVVRPTR